MVVNNVTPNYAISTGTVDQRLDVPFVVAENSGFDVQTVDAPSTLITYTGTEDLQGFITMSFATKHTGGTSRDIQWTIFKNGTELPGARVIRTVASSSWGSIHYNLIHLYKQMIISKYIVSLVALK